MHFSPRAVVYCALRPASIALSDDDEVSASDPDVFEDASSGDSSSGATQKYDGPYFAIRFLLKQPSPFAVMPLVGDPSTVRLNVVPRDFVVDAITTLSERDDNVGTTYQLADPAPLTVEELIDAMERETGKKLLKVPLPLGLAKGAIDHVPGVEPLFEFPSHIVDYFVHPTDRKSVV